MAHKLPGVPSITTPKGYADLKGTNAYLSSLYRDLVRILSELTHHVNQSLDVSGHDRMTGPLALSSYTVATVPDATEAAHLGGLIFVSDEAGGATVAYSDGTDWRRVYDNAVIS